MVLSQLQLAYLHYLELSLTVLHYKTRELQPLCESLIAPFEAPKVEKQQQQNR